MAFLGTVKTRIKKFIHLQSSSSLVLGLCTLLALAIANSPFGPTYFSLLQRYVAGLSVQHWVNDGLMAVFFFVVGLEIKKEIVDGELATWQKAALPISAAFGGMIIPALLYLFFNSSGVQSNGWAIPMATDIAFALGVLTLFGKRVPLALKIFLLALAIVDDLGAVSVIALFYTEKINGLGLAVAACATLLVLGLQRFGVRSYVAYAPLALALWAGTLYSGVHATIAGIVLGFLTPYRLSPSAHDVESSPLDELIHFLHPYVGFLIMPIFAFANAGVDVSGLSISQLVHERVSLGIMAGLVLGKPLGIVLFAVLVVKMGFANFPKDMTWSQLVGVSTLAGIGFTMSIFITTLALPAESSEVAKVAILIASSVSAVVGVLLLKFSLPLAARE